MNDSILPLDEPRLTAYALGELPDPADRAEIEALLRDSAAARAEVEGIRAFAVRLVAEYDGERGASAIPSNLIALPPAAPRPFSFRAALLSMAAALAVAGVILGVSLPRFNRPAAERLPKVAAVPSPAPPVAAAPAPPQEMPAPTASLALAKPAPPADADAARRLIASAAKDKRVDAVTPPTVAGAQSPLDAVSGSLAGVSRDGENPGSALAKSALVPRSEGIDPPIVSPRLAADKSRQAQVDGFIHHGSPAPRGDASAASAPAAAGGALRPPAITAGTRSGTFLAVPGLDDVTGSGSSFRRKAAPPAGTAHYEHREENAFLSVKENPLSTFSADVDTASYANVRRFIEQGSLPPPDAVRVEEMLNYFPYSDAPPAADDPRPFAIHLEAAACPWAPEHRLVRIGIKGREMAINQRPASNLVFLVDVSGSMTPPERLPLIKESLRLLTDRLGDRDRVGIVVYAGESGVALPSTTGEHKDVILAALAGLHAGGSTNGAAGITLAYQIAQEHFIKGGVNRVILATDGDFNVGVTNRAELVSKIEREARGGVFLSVLGVGTGNLQDGAMQMLADRGNGNYAYLDSIAEGRKVLVEQMSGTLVTIAKDVKIQVEFNPAAAAAYRLIGYEKRALRPEDFNNDKIDAGEIGAGHSVTALYEVAPVGQPVPGRTPGVDALKYGPAARSAETAPAAAGGAPGELLTVKLRHKAPDGDRSERSDEAPLVDRGAPGEYAGASADFKFSAAVASFGMLLNGSPYKGSATFEAAAELAREGKGADAGGYRAGFIELVHHAEALSSGGGDR